MARLKTAWLIGLACASLSTSLPVRSEPTHFPFSPGEVLHYKLKWGVLPAGRAVLTVHDLTCIGGVPACHVSLETRTGGVLDRLHRVRTTFAGNFDTFRVEPELKNVGGVFAQSKRPTLQIWFSKDHRSLPVKISSKLFIGHLTAELVAVQSRF